MSDMMERVTIRTHNDWFNFYFDSAADVEELVAKINAAKSTSAMVEIKDHRGQHKYVDAKEVSHIDRGRADFSEHVRPKRRWTGYVMPSQKYFS